MTPLQLDFDAAVEARDKALKRVNDNADDIAKATVDQAIREHAAMGRPFSANTLRPLLPDVPGALMGARFATASRRGLIRKVGYEPSTDPRTHGHEIRVWVKA